jgi:hypothetical protein
VPVSPGTGRAKSLVPALTAVRGKAPRQQRVARKHSHLPVLGREVVVHAGAHCARLRVEIRGGHVEHLAKDDSTQHQHAEPKSVHAARPQPVRCPASRLRPLALFHAITHLARVDRQQLVKHDHSTNVLFFFVSSVMLRPHIAALGRPRRGATAPRAQRGWRPVILFAVMYLACADAAWGRGTGCHLLYSRNTPGVAPLPTQLRLRGGGIPSDGYSTLPVPYWDEATARDKWDKAKGVGKKGKNRRRWWKLPFKPHAKYLDPCLHAMDQSGAHDPVDRGSFGELLLLTSSRGRQV